MSDGVADPHVELRGVSKSFGSTLAVDRIDLAIARGSFTTLLGPSGCGKTTTLRMLAGFFEPDAGEILIDGVRQNEVPPNRRNVSIVFQDYALFPHMTVLQNVSYGLTLRRVEKDERERRVETPASPSRPRSAPRVTWARSHAPGSTWRGSRNRS